MLAPMRPWAWLVLGMMIACGGSRGRDIVTDRHVPSSSGAPSITRIVDLGDQSSVPASGPISVKRSDGRFVVGELILIEGSDFGRLPTISIDGRPADSLARTRDGGIVLRVPTRVSAGSVRVTVSHPSGVAHHSITITRYAMIASSNATHMLRVGKTAVEAEASIDTQGVVALCFSQDGQAGYIATPKTVSVVSMAAADGPARLQTLDVGGAIHSLACRPGLPMLVALTTDNVVLIDTRVPTAVTKAGEVRIEGGITRAVLGPDGQHLALITSSGNELVVVDVSDVQSPSVVTKLGLFPTETVPLLQDLAFSPSGNEIWVLSGNSKQSTAAGLRPTLLTTVKRDGGKLTSDRSATIQLAQAPQFLAVSRRKTIMAAAAVRSTRQRAVMLVSSVSTGLVSPDASAEGRGQLLRVDLDGNATVLRDTTSLYSTIVLTHDQKRVLSATRIVEEGTSAVGLSTISLDGGDANELRIADDSQTDVLAPIPLAIAP